MRFPGDMIHLRQAWIRDDVVAKSGNANCCRCMYTDNNCGTADIEMCFSTSDSSSSPNARQMVCSWQHRSCRARYTFHCIVDDGVYHPLLSQGKVYKYSTFNLLENGGDHA